MNNSIETYAPIFLGFFSLEFIDGWAGTLLTIMSLILVTQKVIKGFKDWNKKDK